jgi:hypothetical protein
LILWGGFSSCRRFSTGANAEISMKPGNGAATPKKKTKLLKMLAGFSLPQPTADAPPPKQPNRPGTQSSGQNGQQNIPGLPYQARPFLGDPPDMR